MSNINETTVLNFYLEEMEKDNIIFLQGKEEYKSQIKESIILIRDEKNPNKRIQSAKNLWKNLFEASMSYIDPDKRGYDGLFKYFDEYVNFEELIFASDAFYRDHTMHCLWVYFLGEYLKKHEEFDFILESMNSGYKSRKTMLSQIEELNLQEKLSEFYKILNDSVKTNNNSESIRCVSALTHDLGYPLKKISKINKSISKILPYFSINNFNEFNFEYSNIQDNYIQDFLENLSTYFMASSQLVVSEDDAFLAEAIYGDKEGNLLGFNVDKIKTFNEEQLNALTNVFSMKYHLVKDMSKHLRYSSDFETFQHGIMSAFLLMKLVRAFENVNTRYSTYDDLKNVSFSGAYGKKFILTAISDHTSNGYKINSIRDDSAFLALVDELEEFSRVSRANQNRQFVSEFCKSNIYIEDGYLNVDFIFDNSSIEGLDPEVSFKGKCNRFLILFDIPNLEENLKIKLRCIGKLPYNNKVYMLEIRRNFANITIDDKEQNIPEYLSSRQFYTKDEYMRK
jgi:hypothetical protein